ncbi:indolepyruvate oxidoreductase subunit beta [Eubacteriales bacterium OttesenSCG-928-K08]|nr:indolepyruvate oxidoreductase subunit beta [Eubacteriales bacterium OttesenSCG-928-K08]
MTTSILLVGVGGQGTILISKILTAGLVKLGFDVKMSEIHGMSQRGGSVTTQIKYSDKVYAPNIGEGEADVIIAFEKAESLRALPFLKKGGTMILDEREIYPMPVLTGVAEYPHNAIDALKAACPNITVIKAAQTAEELGNIRAQNIVLLGALTKVLGLDGVDWKELVAEYVPPKAKELNLKAYDAGQALQAQKTNA